MDVTALFESIQNRPSAPVFEDEPAADESFRATLDNALSVRREDSHAERRDLPEPEERTKTDAAPANSDRPIDRADGNDGRDADDVATTRGDDASTPRNDDAAPQKGDTNDEDGTETKPDTANQHTADAATDAKSGDDTALIEGETAAITNIATPLEMLSVPPQSAADIVTAAATAQTATQSSTLSTTAGPVAHTDNTPAAQAAAANAAQSPPTNGQGTTVGATAQSGEATALANADQTSLNALPHKLAAAGAQTAPQAEQLLAAPRTFGLTVAANATKAHRSDTADRIIAARFTTPSDAQLNSLSDPDAINPVLQNTAQQTNAGGQKTATSINPNGGMTNPALSGLLNNATQAIAANASAAANANAVAVKPGAELLVQPIGELAATTTAGTASSATAINHVDGSLPTPGRAAANPSVQVAIHIARAVQDGNNRISVHLNPPELGRVDVKLDVMADGRVTAIVTADRQETLDLLQRDSRNLEKALQDSGLETDAGSLSFTLRQDTDGTEDKTASSGDDDAPLGEADAGAQDNIAGRPAIVSDRALDISV